MLPVVSGVACLVSAYTTQQGLATATSDLLVSVGVAVAGGSFLFVFSLFLMWRFPYADRNRQLGYGAIAVLVLLLAFGFSTQWSVIAMGGKDALAIHMQRVLDQADDVALGQLRQASVEANLAPQLASLSASEIHAPWLLSRVRQQEAGCVIGTDYPPPVVDHAAARARTLARYAVVRQR